MESKEEGNCPNITSKGVGDLYTIWDWILTEKLQIIRDRRKLYSVILVVLETFDNVILGILDIGRDGWIHFVLSAVLLLNTDNHPWIKEEDGEAPDTPLDDAVQSRLKQFRAMNKFKKAALRVIAGCLSEEEMRGLKEMFKNIDTDNSGSITLEELKQGDIQDLGYDITKAYNFFFVNGEGTLKTVSDDAGVVVLADHLREQMTVDIYVESTGVCHEQNLPEVLAPVSQEKNYNSSEDAEVEEARNNVRKFVELKKSLEQGDQIDADEAPTIQNFDESAESDHGLQGTSDRPGHKYGKESTGDVHIDASPATDPIECVSASQTKHKGNAAPKEKAKRQQLHPKGRNLLPLKGQS
ncbi:hypothetical protein J5N97_029699 [Dioscorea zingiberensis]|uniref:EF-hand domain-containing protein n=1 Tax=Dioscorea zingiberensis TaxID=325984 RepID=A0A9D5BWJ3_9LILI|nr:hypothetical protein J5N97_029699 [Dioscorea zingiberensis]